MTLSNHIFCGNAIVRSMLKRPAFNALKNDINSYAHFMQFVQLKKRVSLAYGKELFILFAASAFRKLSSIYVFSYFPFGFEGRIWDLIVSVPDYCLSFYFASIQC